MGSRVPDWLTPVAWTFLVLSLLSAAAIAVDVRRRRLPQGTVGSALVWITSALYLGPFAVPLYRRHGRRGTHGAGASPAAAALPGGSASAIAHVIGVPLVVASGATIAGTDLWVMIIVIGLLATVLLFRYERAAGRGRTSVGAAAAAAVLTVLAFDVGMGGWMVLLHLGGLMPPATEGSFWFLMQLGVVVGLVTGYPVVRWLLRRRLTAVPA